VCLPTAIDHIELDTAPDRIAAIYPDRSIAKIRSSFAVPRAELDDIDFVTGGADKIFAEISGEPVRLQFQLVWYPRRDKERPLSNPIGIA